MEYVPNRNTNLSDSDNTESAENIKKEGQPWLKIRSDDKNKIRSQWDHWVGGQNQKNSLLWCKVQSNTGQ